MPFPNDITARELLAKLNTGHRSRFLHFRVGQQVKLRLYDGSLLEGIIESMNGDGVTVNNQASTAGGGNVSTTICWSEILESLPLS